MNKIGSSALALVTSCLAFATSAETSSTVDQYQLNLRKGVSDISEQVYDLHMLMFIICVVIGALVFSIMFYSMIFHRKSRGAKPANFHESVKVEIAE